MRGMWGQLTPFVVELQPQPQPRLQLQLQLQLQPQRWTQTHRPFAHYQQDRGC